MFLLISGGHIGGPKRYTNMAPPYKALQRCVKHSTNNSETVGQSDLRLGFFHWTDSNFFFCCVTVKTIYNFLPKVTSVSFNN